MRFSQTSIIAIATLVASKDVHEWADEFSTVSSTDTAAFTVWRSGYEDAYKSWVKSYFDAHPSQKGFATAEVSSIEKSLLSQADAEKTRDYSYFYSELNAIQTDDAFETETGVYETETGVYETETGFYETETGAYETETGAYETTTYSVEPSFSKFSSKPTHSIHLSVSQSSAADLPHSAVKLAAAVSSTGLSTSFTGSRSTGVSSSRDHSSIHSSSSALGSSSSHSSSGMGGQQAPVIVGAALAGLSVLVL